jgi:calcineurin-like phosphoesterase family protein
MKYFWGDPHLDHEKVIDMCARPFQTVDQMNECLISEANSWCERKDELFVMGDFCWDRAAYFRNAIRCKNVHFIRGNHDRRSYEQHFSSASDTRMVKFCSVVDHNNPSKRVECFLSHYPHCFWPKSHHGSLHVYGHLHRQREEWLDRALGSDRRSMDVGVDNVAHLTGRYRPISEFEIAGILLARAGHDHVDYYKAFQKAIGAKGHE